MDDSHTYQVIVHGRVQGVGYRAWTKRVAETANLRGWVKNMPDGTVCITVEGQSEKIDAFLNLLREGPRFAEVSDLKITPLTQKITEDGFDIRP